MNDKVRVVRLTMTLSDGREQTFKLHPSGLVLARDADLMFRGLSETLQSNCNIASAGLAAGESQQKLL